MPFVFRASPRGLPAGRQEVPLELRTQCIEAMYFLYANLFQREPLEHSCHMWWDLIAYDYHCGNRARSNGGEDLVLQDVMFATLTRILHIENVACQNLRDRVLREAVPL